MSYEPLIAQLVNDRRRALLDAADRERVPRSVGRRRRWWRRNRRSPDERPQVSTPHGWTDDVAIAVAEHGIAAAEWPVCRLVREAQAHNLPAVLIDVLADRGQPAVARERALGRLLSAMAAPERPSPTMRDAA